MWEYSDSRKPFLVGQMKDLARCLVSAVKLNGLKTGLQALG